jgi:hypothetical protein
MGCPCYPDKDTEGQTRAVVSKARTSTVVGDAMADFNGSHKNSLALAPKCEFRSSYLTIPMFPILASPAVEFLFNS